MKDINSEKAEPSCCISGAGGDRAHQPELERDLDLHLGHCRRGGPRGPHCPPRHAAQRTCQASYSSSEKLLAG